MGTTAEAVLDTIGTIYDAAADFEQWPVALSRVADLFGVEIASLGAMKEGGVPWLFAPRSDPHFQSSYVEHYYALDSFAHEIRNLPVGAAVTDAMVMPKAARRSGEFYADWLRPQRHDSCLGATVLAEDGWQVKFFMPSRRDFTQHHLDIYGALAPHLMRAVQLGQRIERSRIAEEATAASLNCLDQGVILVDGACHVLFANPAAEAAFGAGNGLRLLNRVLRAESPVDTTVLQGLIYACSRDSIDGSGGHLRVARSSGRPPLSLLVIPLRRKPSWIGKQRPAAIVFVSDPAIRHEPDTGQLQRLFGLTSAEAAFVVETLRGDGMQAVADRLGIKVGTARTHLHRVLSKTGTTRQADLVRLVLENRHRVRRH